MESEAFSSTCITEKVIDKIQTNIKQTSATNQCPQCIAELIYC